MCQYAVLSAVQIKQYSYVRDRAESRSSARAWTSDKDNDSSPAGTGTSAEDNDSIANARDEVVIIPGSRFMIDDIKRWEYDVAEVQMHQLPPEVPDRRRSNGASATPAQSTDPLAAAFGTNEMLYEDMNDYLAPGELAFKPSPPVLYDLVGGCMYSAPNNARPAAGCAATASSSSSTALPLSSSSSAPRRQRPRPATVYSVKCARGRECSRQAPPGSLYCLEHACKHVGCTKSKSSVGSTCPDHAHMRMVQAPKELGKSASKKQRHAYVNVPDKGDGDSTCRGHTHRHAIQEQKEQNRRATKKQRHAYVNLPDGDANRPGQGAVIRGGKARASGNYGFGVDEDI